MGSSGGMSWTAFCPGALPLRSKSPPRRRWRTQPSDSCLRVRANKSFSVARGAGTRGPGVVEAAQGGIDHSMGFERLVVRDLRPSVRLPCSSAQCPLGWSNKLNINKGVSVLRKKGLQRVRDFPNIRLSSRRRIYIVVGYAHRDTHNQLLRIERITSAGVQSPVWAASICCFCRRPRRL